jgi:hypothetical protein
MVSSALFAERIVSSSCEIKKTIDGQPLFKLNEFTEVACGVLENNAYKILIRVWVASDAWTDENEIKKNKILYDSLGNKIGKTIGDISPERFFRIDPDGRAMVDLLGYVPYWNIEKMSIIENDLEVLLRANQKQFTVSDFEDHFKKFIYKDFYASGSFTSKIYNESVVTQLKPGGRIVLIFYKEELAAIVYSRTLKATWYESAAESKPYKIYYMKKMSDAEKKELADSYFNKVSQR